MKARKIKKSDADNSERPQSADKVEAILKGAIQEFLTHGYAATTMDRVTAAAGVSKATVYSYFQDKESLFAALVEQLTQKNYQDFNPQDPKFWEGEPAEVLRKLAVNLLKKVECKHEFRDLVRLIIGESGRFPVLAQIFVRNVDQKLFHHLVEYLKSRQELQLPDPEAAARVFIGTLVHYVIVQHMLQAHNIMPMESDRLIDTLIYLLTVNQKDKLADKYAGTRHKSWRRKRSADGKFEPDYQSEPKRLRSIRLTDTAWEQLAAIAEKNQITRSEAIEIFARNGEIELDFQ
ncbi:TetR/AcrR family transcriptional regulator [Aerosakkonema funiforme]|uniref:TetR/AcrR family transcriptional regulator n=1 Tax=Aerosakkonema funiforme TaxID=1246630 RepID=UPI0035B84663